MDNLTHALTGALICDALPRTKRLGGKAVWAAAFAAAAPDLDMLPAIISNFPPAEFSRHALFAGDLVRRFHRAESHSLFFYALVFVPLAYAAWRWSGRTGRLRDWAALCLLCLCSHTLLDFSNRYGIRPWLPFSEERYALGIFSLFDIPLLVILAGVFILNHVLRSGQREPPDFPSESAPAPASLRERAAAGAGRLAGVGTIGKIGLALVAGRIFFALVA